jgi:hypothetical protein
LHGPEILSGHQAQGSLHRLDKFHKRHRLIVANIQQAVGRAAGGWVRVGRVKRRVGCGGLVSDADDTFDDIVDIREIALEVSAVKDIDRPSLRDVICKECGRHVGATPRAVNGKKP